MVFIHHSLLAAKVVVWHNAKKKSEDKRRIWTFEIQLQDFRLLFLFFPWV